MLKLRVFTAIVLLLILLPALFYPSPEPFCFAALILIAAGAWEWGNLNGCSGVTSLAMGGMCFLTCVVTWVLGWLDRSTPFLWLLVGVFWVVGGAWLLKVGVPAWSRFAKWFRLVIGLLALSVAWLAVAQARVIGVNFLLSVLVLVWVADVFAYFAGRTLGGRFTTTKLAPSISPGKSWEGVWGGMAGVMVLALVWRWQDVARQVNVPSFYSHLFDKGWWLLLVALPFMVAMSVVGDLVESLLKRSAGVKDSSGLLPGHGGVLDRVDALLPALPLAMMFYSF